MTQVTDEVVRPPVEVASARSWPGTAPHTHAHRGPQGCRDVHDAAGTASRARCLQITNQERTPFWDAVRG